MTTQPTNHNPELRSERLRKQHVANDPSSVVTGSHEHISKGQMCSDGSRYQDMLQEKDPPFKDSTSRMLGKKREGSLDMIQRFNTP